MCTKCGSPCHAAVKPSIAVKMARFESITPLEWRLLWLMRYEFRAFEVVYVDEI